VATTLNPALILAQQFPKYEQPDFGGTMVNIAKMRAYEQQRRIDELKLGQAERAAARDEEWRSLWGEVFKPQGQQPSGGGGLTGALPQGGPMPQGPPPQGPQMPASAPVSAPAAMGGLADARQPGAMPAAPTGGMPLSQTEFTGPQGMAANIPTGVPMDVNTQTGEWGLPPSPDQQLQAGVQQSLAAAPQGQAPMANVGMPQATGGLTGTPPVPAQGPPPPAAPAPAPGPQGLTGERPGLPEMPGLQLPQINEQAFWRAYAKDPEKTTKAFGDYVEVQGKKLEQVEKTNDQIYNTLLAVEGSDDPAKFWPRALKDLRKKGIPIPNDMPEQYDPALSRFLLKQHEGVKARVENAKERYYDAQAMQNRALGRKQESEIKTPQERTLEIQQKLATLNETIAKTDDLPKRRALEEERNTIQAIEADIKRDEIALRRQGQTQTAEHQTRTAEQSFLGEWNKVATPYRDISDAYSMIESGGKGTPGPAADQLIVNGFLRMLDPKTGIRDGERRDFLTSGGLLQKIQRGEAYVTGTTQLRPEFKKDILARTRDAYNQAMTDYDQRMVDFRGIAERQKLDPNNVVVDFRSTAKKAQEQPPSAKTAATADPASSSINREDFMEWRRRNKKTGSVTDEETKQYFAQRGGRTK
jgi:hypothetical protein